MNIHSMIVAGIDTAKEKLVVRILPGEVRQVFDNEPAGILALVAFCRAAGVVRAGIEATSIYHRAAMKALRAGAIEVAELQPRQVRGFAQAVLRWSKSDPIDAHVIARLTQVIDEVRPGPPENIERLAESLTYIEQLEERAAQLKTSLERYGATAITAVIGRDIKATEKRRKRLLEKLKTGLCKDLALDRRFQLLVSIPGRGRAYRAWFSHPHAGAWFLEPRANRKPGGPGAASLRHRQVQGRTPHLRRKSPPAQNRLPLGFRRRHAMEPRPQELLCPPARQRPSSHRRHHRMRPQTPHSRQRHSRPRHAMGTQAGHALTGA